jgi:hypothetical protein
MPERETVERAKRAKRKGKAPSSQAGEFVREEVHHHVREKASMAPDPRNKRSRSVYRRRDVPALVCRRPRKARFPRRPGAVPSALMSQAGGATPRHLIADPEPPKAR